MIEKYTFHYIVKSPFPISKIGIYDRASTKSQANNGMRSHNMKLGKEFCNKYGYEIITTGLDVCSRSAFDKNSRSQFYAMLEDESIDTILIPGGFDRFACGEAVNYLCNLAENTYKTICYLEDKEIDNMITNMIDKFFGIVKPNNEK